MRTGVAVCSPGKVNKGVAVCVGEPLKGMVTVGGVDGKN